MSKYRKGAVAKTIAAIRMTRLRPMMSERIPAGMLTKMPTTVEAAAMKPSVDSETPKERIKSGKAGFLAIVELKMASPPMIQSIKKGEIFLGINFHCKSEGLLLKNHEILN
jgi:hypothetical protein